ncbi:Imm52 family immunity protein [Rhodococcus sp. IEGM 1330]|uniref:Imm52 family immunity protein n=1 Tax=Rhodococcus sp. IEGM 1330 TaxID=3082225 RepID=UPI00295554CD|nr:Imm52 family immunity protein [Rhodococcus sp. IEGM 1330]MDV8022206.1 hypothetical protein [Rhodococcus sp. IEGM 1330]
MSEHVAVTVSWGSRVESAARCAERLLDSLNRLPAQDEIYSDWYVYPAGGANGPDDLLPAPADLDSLAALVDSTALKNNRGEVMSGGGFSPLLTRLHREGPVDYRVRCGVERTRLGNHGLLKLPHPDHADPLANDETAIRDSLKALTEAWEPEYGAAMTYSFMQAQNVDDKAMEIPIGWLTYLANSVALDESKLTELAQLTRVDGGIYLQLHGTPQEPSLDDALGVRRALGYAVR